MIQRVQHPSEAMRRRTGGVGSVNAFASVTAGLASEVPAHRAYSHRWTRLARAYQTREAGAFELKSRGYVSTMHKKSAGRGANVQCNLQQQMPRETPKAMTNVAEALSA
jgi:hypothetical protein